MYISKIILITRGSFPAFEKLTGLRHKGGFDKQIHWISIINSFILVKLKKNIILIMKVIILIGFVIIIITRVVKNEVSKATDIENPEKSFYHMKFKQFYRR